MRAVGMVMPSGLRDLPVEIGIGEIMAIARFALP
jgi:hypothetical protein